MFAAPVAAGPMLVGLMISTGEIVWLFTLFTSITVALMADPSMSFVYLLVSAIGGIAAARGVFSCQRRNDIYRAGIRTGLVNGAVLAVVTFLQPAGEAGYLNHLMWNVPLGFAGGLLSSMVAMAFIPLLESIFNYTTDVKLLELSSLNHPLMKDMIVKAPGTYHHSLVVGSMCEAGAEEIGANPLLAKVMAYYHDIGKMEHAQYFIENQRPGHNAHDHISPHMSKTVLVAHVKDGAEMGYRHALGKPIIDGILQHHGTTLISYFYNKAIEELDEEMDQINENDFRYPGPKPQFREAALLMIADSIEAAARSIEEPTPARLTSLVRNIIQNKFLDGQLDQMRFDVKRPRGDRGMLPSSHPRHLPSAHRLSARPEPAIHGGVATRPITSGSAFVPQEIIFRLMTPILINRCRFDRMPRRFLEKWIGRLSKQKPFRSKQGELVIVFVDAAEMKSLNRKYRGRNYATDVLSFEAEGSVGELVVCPQVLRAQAKDTGLSFRHELGYMVIHGALHLLGFDHENSAGDAKRMFALQDRIFTILRKN